MDITISVSTTYKLETNFQKLQMSDSLLYLVLFVINEKQNRKARWKLTSYHASAPMERVHLDFIGPFPLTSKQNVYVLMMVDQFTKWVECVPLPNQSAEETARTAINQFFCHFSKDSFTKFLQIEVLILRVNCSSNFVKDYIFTKQEQQLSGPLRMSKQNVLIEPLWML